ETPTRPMPPKLKHACHESFLGAFHEPRTGRSKVSKQRVKALVRTPRLRRSERQSPLLMKCKTRAWLVSQIVVSRRPCVLPNRLHLKLEKRWRSIDRDAFWNHVGRK